MSDSPLAEKVSQLEKQIDKIDHAYFGNGVMGDRTKVAILWRIHVAGVGIAGTVAGALLTRLMM